MKIETLGEVVATRHFFLADDENQEPVVSVRIGKPQPFPDQRDFFCPVEIRLPDSTRLTYTAGVDEIQTLRLMMKLLKSELEYVNGQFGGRLRWLGDESGDLGFA